MGSHVGDTGVGSHVGDRGVGSHVGDTGDGFPRGRYGGWVGSHVPTWEIRGVGGFPRGRYGGGFPLSPAESYSDLQLVLYWQACQAPGSTGLLLGRGARIVQSVVCWARCPP